MFLVSRARKFVWEELIFAKLAYDKSDFSDLVDFDFLNLVKCDFLDLAKSAIIDRF